MILRYLTIKLVLRLVFGSKKRFAITVLLLLLVNALANAA